MSRHGQPGTPGNPQKHNGAWKGPKPGAYNNSASQSRMWKCQGSGGCGYGWNNFSNACCQKCNASWQYDKRSPQRDGRASGKDPGAPDNSATQKSPKPASKPTSTRWGVWEWKWDGDIQAQAPETVDQTVDETKALADEIGTLQQNIIQLEALLGGEHSEVGDRKTKLETLLLRQKDSQPIMPHDQKLRKNLWEVRDCDVKLKKLQTSFEAAQLKTCAAQQEEDEVKVAIATVSKQRNAALAIQQDLLSLCKTAGGKPPPPIVQKEWVEGMAGLQTFMSVCQAMENMLSEDDKTLLGTMQVIQNRMAQRTAVADDEDDDDAMVGKKGGDKFARPDEHEEHDAKKQKTDDQVEEVSQAPPAEATPGSSSGPKAGVDGISNLPKHELS
jgi:hypothetical protein